MSTEPTKTVDVTNTAEVTAKQVALIHTKLDSTASELTRTVLGLASQDDLSVTVEDEDSDFTPGAEYTTRRYATSGTITGEVTSAIATDLSALSLIGLADSDGKLIKSGKERKIGFGESEWIEIAYFEYEPDFTTIDIEADSELLQRFGNVKVQNPEFDASEAPLKVSMELWIEGDFWLDYSSSSGT